MCDSLCQRIPSAYPAEAQIEKARLKGLASRAQSGVIGALPSNAPTKYPTRRASAYPGA